MALPSMMESLQERCRKAAEHAHLHLAAKDDPAVWDLLIVDARPWPDLGLEVGECRLCWTTISRVLDH